MSVRLSLPVLLPCVAVAALLNMADAGRGHAAATGPEILFSCDVAPVLCEALIAALGERGASVRPATADPEVAADATRMRVRLHMEDHSQTRVRGHLSWQMGTAPAAHGPSFDLTVMDHVIQDDMLRDFADLLVARSGLPF
ncbi:hypothetical protein [Chachezhania sediminis]|uniref:hypothetical protein n=1 Tax=Chachezhania sediminis TaxID=2599291 RepID=UPI00131AAFD3|nr:hypothetical protein [Chachezhania sediminis]